MNNQNPTWERLDTDTDKSYEAFCIYRDMGSNRTLRKLAQELNKTLTQIGDWSSKHNWQERVSAYDDYLREEHRIRLETAKLKVAENVLDDYEELRKAVKKRLKVIAAMDYVVMEDDLNALLTLMHRLDDYARRAVGLPEKITEQKNEHSGTVQTQNTNVNIDAENAHDATNILNQLAELGAIPPNGSQADNDATSE